MAEVLLEFEGRFDGPDGRAYEARVCGREREDGSWEGWIEFVAPDHVVATGRETTQPRRELLHYWATGLTAAYLDGALLRTLRPAPEIRPRSVGHATPAFDAPPAHPPRREATAAPAPRADPAARPVLDPFAVFAEGDHVLHGQLEALSDGQLRTIIRAYGLGRGAWGRLESMNRYELAHHVLHEVRQRVEQR
jgi:hypothetical protein